MWNSNSRGRHQGVVSRSARGTARRPGICRWRIFGALAALLALPAFGATIQDVDDISFEAPQHSRRQASVASVTALLLGFTA